MKGLAPDHGDLGWPTIQDLGPIAEEHALGTCMKIRSMFYTEHSYRRTHMTDTPSPSVYNDDKQPTRNWDLFIGQEEQMVRDLWAALGSDGRASDKGCFIQLPRI